MSKVAVSAVIFGTIVFSTLVSVQITEAKPTMMPILNRHKRVSDRRADELESYVGLSKVKGKVVSIPIGFGQIDPDRLGRRRRSSNHHNVSDLLRILRAVIFDNVKLTPQDQRIYAQFLSSQWDATDQEETAERRAEEDDELQFY